MTPPLITALVAAVLGLWFILLGFNVIKLRVKTGISINHGDSEELAVAIRRHGNLAESLAFVLILLGLLEMLGGPDWAIYSLGGLLVIARIVHPFGLAYDNPAKKARAIGALGTGLVTIVSSVWLVAIYIAS